MRKVAFITTAAIAVGGTVGVAYAAVDKTQGLTVKTSSASGTKKKPKKVSLDVTTSTKAVTQAQSGTFAATEAVISFDKNLKFNNTKFPTCTAPKAVAGTCPADTKVGSGAAEAEVGTGGPIVANFKITAYNGAKGTLILFLQGLKTAKYDATAQQKTIIGTLKPASGKYGRKLVVPIPKDVQQPVPGLRATLTSFNTKVSKTYKGINYVESVGCSAKKYNFSGAFKFDDGDAKTALTTAACK